MSNYFRFGLMTLTREITENGATFVFFARQTPQLGDERRRFKITKEDIHLLNPNTHTSPVVHSNVDAELTKRIYRRVPVVINDAEGVSGNPWGINFMRMFDMANDSALFLTARQLLDAEAVQSEGEWVGPDGERMVPLYEAKMIHHYDHRWAT